MSDNQAHSRTYLGVVVLLVIYEAGVGDTRLTHKGLVVPVGGSRQNGGLTDLANHQNLHHMQQGFTPCTDRATAFLMCRS